MDRSDLMNKINGLYDEMSKGQKLIATYILNNYDKAAFMTASKLSQQVGISESTVVRFAHLLGYEGYPKLQKSLQELIRNKLTSVQRMEMTAEMDSSTVLRTVLKSDMQNIRFTRENTDEVVFAQVVDAIIKAQQVYIFGVRASATLAQFMGYYLNFMMDNVKIVDSGYNDVMEQIMHANSSDVCIGISFPRYSNRTLEGMILAKQNGATVIAITDSAISPLVSCSDYCLFAKSDMASFVDSLAAPLSLINALIVAISLKKRDELADYFSKLEGLWDKYKIYSGKQK